MDNLNIENGSNVKVNEIEGNLIKKKVRFNKIINHSRIRCWKEKIYAKRKIKNNSWDIIGLTDGSWKKMWRKGYKSWSTGDEDNSKGVIILIWRVMWLI